MNEERTLTKEQQQAFEEMLQEKTYCGDAFSAFRLFTNYLKGTNGFRKDPDKAFEYLKISSDLGYPHAINLLKLLYSGNDLYGLKIERYLRKRIECLEKLSVADQLFDFSTVTEEERNEFYQMEWNALAELGRLYILDSTLYEEDNYKGYCLSLYVAGQKGTPESLCMLGYYFDCYRPPQYVPSNTLLKKRGNLGTALYYYECAINTDNSKYANLALEQYNRLAEQINVSEGRTEENMIPYYRR